MSFPRHWKASLNPKEYGGVAAYMIDGRRYKLWMSSFRNFTLMGDLIDYAFAMGLEHGKQMMRSRVLDALAPTYNESMPPTSDPDDDIGDPKMSEG